MVLRIKCIINKRAGVHIVDTDNLNRVSFFFFNQLACVFVSSWDEREIKINCVWVFNNSIPYLPFERNSKKKTPPASVIGLYKIMYPW